MSHGRAFFCDPFTHWPAQSCDAVKFPLCCESGLARQRESGTVFVPRLADKTLAGSMKTNALPRCGHKMPLLSKNEPLIVGLG